MKKSVEEAVYATMGCFGVCVTLGGIAGAILFSAMLVIKAAAWVFELLF